MKKLLFILLPLILVLAAGVVVGLGFMGIINLPFLPHKKLAKKKGAKTVPLVAAAPEKKVDVAPAIPLDPPKPKPKDDAPKPDVEAGEKKLASVWNSLEAMQLLPIVKDWKDPDLARILVRMDADKVTELLGAVDPDRASKLSRAIEAAAARPKIPVKLGA